MSTNTLDESKLGLPVEIGRIDKELGRLWEESGDTKTRASLINLAIYTECPESLESNTEIIAALAGEHACRALLVLGNPDAKESRARAWISAHCQMAGKGERQVCSEQITFLLEGDVANALPSIVFSHLDSDLPLCFWWQEPFREPLDEKLWNWMDRLLFDSQTWPNPAEQLARVRQIGNFSNGRTVLCDLNWARLLSSRFALASFFDNTAALAHLRKLRSVKITHAPGARMTALLLLGWLAAQLGWTRGGLLSQDFFTDGEGNPVTFELIEGDGACVGCCEFESDDARFVLRRDPGAEFFHAEMSGNGVPEIRQMLSAGKERIVDILAVELGRGGRHPLYLKAIQAIEDLI